MNTPSPNGPTIPLSSNFSANFTRILKVTDYVRGNSFFSPNDSLGLNTTLSEGTLSNLNNPLLDSQGATLDYVNNTIDPTDIPGGPLKSLQYNNSGSFNGQSTLTFDKSTNVLNANEISIATPGIVNIIANTIDGLATPTDNQNAATKSYVDNYIQFTNVAIIGSTTYSASDLIYGMIYRDSGVTGTTTDILPTAAQIIAASGAIVGTTITFAIKNISSDYDNIITFTNSTGITFSGQQNIFSGYQYSGIMIVTNIDPGQEALTLYTLNCSISNSSNYAIELGSMASIVGTVRITDFLMISHVPTLITTQINTTSVANKVNYMTPSSPVNIELIAPYNFAGIDSLSLITEPFIWKSGGVDFYIVNQSTTAGANITLIGESATVSWTMDPNSNMIIPPGFTGWFIIYLTITNYPDITSLTAANVYTLGIFPNGL